MSSGSIYINESLVNVEKYVISKDKIFKDEESFNIIKILVLVN